MDNNPQNIFWTVIRATPFILPPIIACATVINPNQANKLFFIASCLTSISSPILKYTFKTLYNLLGTDTLPILGRGSRPGPCITFFSWKTPDLIAFGMPSGHSQMVWFVAIYLILAIFRNNRELQVATKLIIYSVLVSSAIIISYSRVFIDKCHTIEQVIVGGLIGSFTAIVTHMLDSPVLAI